MVFVVDENYQKIMCGIELPEDLSTSVQLKDV